MNVVENIILGLSIAIPVGPSSLIIIRNGLKYGFRAAFVTSFGIISADTLCLLIVFFGLVNFLDFPYVKFALLLLGACVLFLIGLQDSLELLKKIPAKTKKRNKKSKFFLSGFSVNISNPLAIVFWLGIYGSLLATTKSSPSNLRNLFLSLAIVLGIFLWQMVLSFLTNWGKKYLKAKYFALLTTLAGLILILYGLNFAYNALLLVSK